MESLSSPAEWLLVVEQPFSWSLDQVLPPDPAVFFGFIACHWPISYVAALQTA